MAMTLREMIERDVDPMFNIADLEYRLYLQDHKEHIMARCEKVFLTPDDMALYEHRPRRFLVDKKLPQASDWILCWLNDMSGPEEFKNKKFLYVPSYKQLEDLYGTYRTLRARMNSMTAQLTSK